MSDNFDLQKGGVKDDNGKTRMDLIPVYPLQVLGDIYTYGAVKYDDWNWAKGMRWGRVFAATLRHLFAFWRGELVDKESGLPHLGHAAFGIFTLLEFTRSPRYSTFDDRWKDPQ